MVKATKKQIENLWNNPKKRSVYDYRLYKVIDRGQHLKFLTVSFVLKQILDDPPYDKGIYPIHRFNYKTGVEETFYATITVKDDGTAYYTNHVTGTRKKLKG